MDRKNVYLEQVMARADDFAEEMRAVQQRAVPAPDSPARRARVAEEREPGSTSPTPRNRCGW